MTQQRHRLTRLMQGLSARERAILELHALKQGAQSNPAWRARMSSEQATEFNNYIGLMNAANIYLSSLISLLELMVARLDLRCSGLFALQLWQGEREAVGSLVCYALPEPITESEYGQKVQAAAESFLPVAELAELLTQDHAWQDDDLEQPEGWPVPVVKPEARERVQRGIAGDLRRTAATGGVPAKGEGAALSLQVGSVFAHAGIPVVAYPDWLGSYEVVPDDQAAEVEAQRWAIGRLRGHVEASLFDAPTGALTPGQGIEFVQRDLADRIVQAWQTSWQELLAVEHVLDEIASHFNGEDPLKPVTRAGLANARQGLLDQRDELALHAGIELELAERDESETEQVRLLVDRAMALFT